ncbi:MAG: peptidoglycan-binding protein [Syntrophomonadaceae bacterium]|nr:peptidoglycan-binding protein [Syntrophomonadaceae bacterium]MDD3024125.1 peptidoglycan-binding protein [Syntrophomonadaceae bacterium]
MLHKVMTMTIVILGLFLFNATVMAAEEKVAKNEQKLLIPLRVDRTDYPDLYLCEAGIEGEAVWMLQARLKELGYDIEPNGIYSKDTSQVVKLFQTANGLQDNGIVSQSVWENLMVSEANEPCVAENNSEQEERLLIEIDVAKRSLTLYKNDIVFKQYPVAVGKSSTPSPLGEWKIVQKSLNWGNGFGTRWMGLNVPWGIFGIHGTNKPGSIGTFASHGCIRMLNRHVEDLYPNVKEGTMVRIVENGKMFPEDLKPVTLQKKSSGQRVVYVQSRLKELGLVFDRADGRFGNMTELAVKYYQVWHDLQPTGIVDEGTYRAMGMIK